MFFCPKANEKSFFTKFLHLYGKLQHMFSTPWKTCIFNVDYEGKSFKKRAFFPDDEWTYFHVAGNMGPRAFFEHEFGPKSCVFHSIWNWKKLLATSNRTEWFQHCSSQYFALNFNSTLFEVTAAMLSSMWCDGQLMWWHCKSDGLKQFVLKHFFPFLMMFDTVFCTL